MSKSGDVSKSGDAMLPGTPAFLAAGDAQILVADREGNLLWWDWPARVGSLVHAHDDGGPLAASVWFASTGGWDPTVKRWDPGASQPRFTAMPFTGRVTALCIQGNDVLVAGMNKAGRQADVTNKDRAALTAGGVVRLDPDGKPTPLALEVQGEVSQLACGANWVIAADQAAPGALRALVAGKPRVIPVTGGPATALVGRGGDAVVATQTGVWIIDPHTGRVSPLARLNRDSPRIQSLLAIGHDVFAATSEGVLRWPNAKPITHRDQQAVALARFASDLLVLWDDGSLEQWTVTGTRVRAVAVPHEP